MQKCTLYVFKETPCFTPQELDCVKNMKVDTNRCLKSCSGLVVTSFAKSELKKDLETLFPILEDYNLFKRVTPYPSNANGIIMPCIWNIFSIIFLTLGYEWKNKLRYVKIYFDTPTFDRIEKDRAAKFVDILSAIGGTMGLLTGFSIISAVEILYFASKLVLNILHKKMKKTV